MVIKAPKAKSAGDCERLEQLPNIGPSLAADLRRIGIQRPADLRGQDAYALYRAPVRGDRPAPGSLRARHLHGRDRLHARRRRRAVVEVHGAAQGDLRRALSRLARRAAPASRRGWKLTGSNRPVRGFRGRGAIQQSTGRQLPAPSSSHAMFRALFSRSRLRDTAEPASRRLGASRRRDAAAAGVSGRPWTSRLGEWLGASGWRVSRADLPSASAGRWRVDALAEARLDFAEALIDVRSTGAAAAIERIAVTRSLHELWHLRGEVFDAVSLRHDQAEASRRLAVLDRHFATPPRRSGATARTPRRRPASADAAAAAAACCSAPRKSFLPSSTPLWRRSAYVVVTWKKKFGSAKCFRYASPLIVIGPARRGTEISFASLPTIFAAGTDFR